MAKNTKRGASRGNSRNTRKSTANQRQVPGWVWLFTGVMTGLFIAFLYHLAQTQMTQGDNTGNTSDTTASSTQPADNNAETSDDSPQFDFYAVLPQMEVIVPQTGSEQAQRESTSSTQTERASQGTARTPSRNNERYVLQAGSFRSNADADRRRAELILQGFDATVQSVKLENGNSWHRVMIGPYNNQNTMHRAQDQLAANGIETLPIKVKQ